MMYNEKSPGGLSSDSLGLNTSSISDTLKDYALKLVANAHSEMSDEQWSDWLNEHTEAYTEALAALLSQAIDQKIDAIVGEASKLKQDEHPIDPETGAAVEVYGYEATYNQALDATVALLQKHKQQPNQQEEAE